MLSKKIKIKLNHNQQIKLETLSNEHRLLYNFLLEKTKKIIDFKQLNKYYKDYRNINNLTIQSKSAQNTCISLINNIKSYLSLKKKDKTSKFPYKFKSYRYFTSFMLDYNIGHGGFKIINNQLHLNLKQRYKYKLIIDLPDYVNDITSDNIKTITFKKENNNYYLIFVYQEDKLNYNLNKNNFLGIDLGYSDLLVGVSNKGNIKISNLRQKKLQNNVEEVQSIKDKLEKGSRRYNKTNETFKRKKKKLFNTQKDFQHKSSKKIIDFCINNDIGSIILGDIKVKKIVKKENKKINGLSKSTSSLSRFKTYLE